MGKYNSSVYRVRTLMEIVENDYAAFLELLSLVRIPAMGIPKTYHYDGAQCSEKQLKPSKRHMSALIAYMAAKDHTGISVANVKRQNYSLLMLIVVLSLPRSVDGAGRTL